ncbi:putative amino acid transporter, transmembrane domain-containing protein [Helianthus annuus]|uniref:Amino acid transporter, transmembrane domain-containing protein n=2 Tax=Helianthus annuus TaxID=4232 RepID=A0A251RMU4_HELAN|nr:putative amino acid transporter, transmembrane domain-containing protein [Helianthus annuus]KAJ0812423.1 putative amino acid transporter, transmembrane domain-containing protein [Helianthus annuus]
MKYLSNPHKISGYETKQHQSSYSTYANTRCFIHTSVTIFLPSIYFKPISSNIPITYHRSPLQQQQRFHSISMVFDNNNETNSSSNPIIRSIPREDSPLLGTSDSLSSTPKTFANIFIAIVGAGVLGLPYTFMRTGWLTGFIMIFVVSGLAYRGMMLLVETRRKLETPLTYSRINSFGDLGFAVCGPIGRFVVDILILASQAGFCVGYLIFIGNTLSHLFHSAPVESGNYLNAAPYIWGLKAKTFYIWGCFPFQLGLNAIPTLTLLAPLSIFADIVDVGAMSVVMVQDVVVFLKTTTNVHAFGSFSTFCYGLGVALFSFEGIGMALPLEAEARDKKRFGFVLGWAMFSIAAMYGVFGVLGYFAFGENTRDIVTANMGKGMLSSLVQLGLCVNLFFTFPLMMHPVYEVMERRYWEGRYCLWMRWVLVMVVSLVALLVPNFTDFLSLVGSSTCCILGLVLPALFHYIVFKNELKREELMYDLAMIVLGVILGVLGTWFSLMEMLF